MSSRRRIAPEKLAPGKHTIKFDFKYDGPGYWQGRHRHTLRGRRSKSRKAKSSNTIPIRFSLDETFDIGMDTGTPVVEDYVDKMPFKFTRHAQEGRDRTRQERPHGQR